MQPCDTGVSPAGCRTLGTRPSIRAQVATALPSPGQRLGASCPEAGAAHPWGGNRALPRAAEEEKGRRKGGHRRA